MIGFKNLVTAILLLVLFASSVAAQNPEIQQRAFASSYAHEEAGRFREAIDELEGIYDRSSYEINLRLGWLYHLFGDCDQSLKTYERALEIMPYSIEARLGLVLPLADKEEWDRVISVYNDILKQDPQNAIANYRLGAIYYERSEYEIAKRYAEKVVNMYPYDFDSVILLGWINLRISDFRKARILFRKSLLIRPENSSALEALAMMNPVIE